MSSRSTRKRLEDIRENIVLARQFIGTMTFEAFADSTATVYAVTRALEIISEASRHLSDAIKQRHSGIDWVSVRDAGNLYRHGYELVAEHRIWDTVNNHLEALERAVLAELEATER